MSCAHEEYAAKVAVSNVQMAAGPDKQVAEVTINCARCGTRFVFLGLQPGFGWGHPTVSMDGLEATLPIAAEGTAPRPFDELQAASGPRQ